MNREYWMNSNTTTDLEYEDRVLGHTFYSFHRPDHTDTPQRLTHAAMQHSSPYGLVLSGNNSVYASPFTNLEDDRVLEPGHTEAAEEDEHDEEEASDSDSSQDRKPAARHPEEELSHRLGHNLNRDPFVPAVPSSIIDLSYSKDAEDENKNDYPGESIGILQLNHSGTPGLSTRWADGYDVPQATSPYQPVYPVPPPPPQSYRFGSNISMPSSMPTGYSAPELAARSPPLAALQPRNTQHHRLRGRQLRQAKKSKKATKKKTQVKTKIVSKVKRSPPEIRRPTSDELFAATTKRALDSLLTWYERLNELIEYKSRFGDCNVPQKYDANPPLGIWVNKQRMEKKFLDEGERSSMTESKLRVLESIGFHWAKRKGQPSWDARYAQLKAYKAKHGHCKVPTKYQDNPALGRWVSTQRSQFKQWREGLATPMTEYRVNLLNEIGFTWNMLNDHEDENESTYVV